VRGKRRRVGARSSASIRERAIRGQREEAEVKKMKGKKTGPSPAKTKGGRKKTLTEQKELTQGEKGNCGGKRKATSVSCQAAGGDDRKSDKEEGGRESNQSIAR